MPDTLSNVLNDILNPDSFSTVVVGGLTILTGLMIRSMSSSTALAIWFAPGLAFGGLLGIYGCREAGFAFIGDSDSNVILSAGAGIIAGVIVMLVLTRMAFALTGVRKPVTRSGGARP